MIANAIVIQIDAKFTIVHADTHEPIGHASDFPQMLYGPTSDYPEFDDADDANYYCRLINVALRDRH